MINKDSVKLLKTSDGSELQETPRDVDYEQKYRFYKFMTIIRLE